MIGPEGGVVGDDHAAFRGRRVFGNLDGLRAVAILAVIWHHSLAGRPTGHRLLDGGFHGVELFFVISGFLITTLLLREREARGRIHLGRFYARRTLRIFPLYYAMLGLQVLIFALVPGEEAARRAFFGNLPLHLTYTSNWAVNKDPFAFSWSLACEEQFYLVWPAFLVLLRPRLAAAAMGLFLLTRHGIDLGESHGVFDREVFAVAAILKVPPTLGLGVLGAFLLHHPRGFAVGRRLLGWRGADLAAVGLLALAIHRPELASLPGAIDLALALVVLSFVVREKALLGPLLRFRAVAWIGKVSYGTYLMHVLVIGALHRIAYDAMPPGSASRFVAAAALTTAAASLSFRTFEAFFLRFKSRFAA